LLLHIQLYGMLPVVSKHSLSFISKLAVKILSYWRNRLPYHCLKKINFDFKQKYMLKNSKPKSFLPAHLSIIYYIIYYFKTSLPS